MDDGVHVILLRGAGEKFFCAGADIKMLQTVTPRFKYYFCLHANETLNRLEQTPKLVIAALNGHCVGGGLEVALAADMRFARRGTGKLGLPEVQLDVLRGLASGMSVQEVWEELAERIVSGVDSDDLLTAARRTPERIRFVSGPVELAARVATDLHRELDNLRPRVTLPMSAEDRDNRSRMLARMQSEVRGRLDDVLHGAAWIELGLEHRPDAVPARRGQIIREHASPESSPLSVADVVDAFDEFDGELLILGAAGAVCMKWAPLGANEQGRAARGAMSSIPASRSDA
jgi:enoyl-CoA hydratase/carnithine racemase